MTGAPPYKNKATANRLKSKLAQSNRMPTIIPRLHTTKSSKFDSLEKQQRYVKESFGAHAIGQIITGALSTSFGGEIYGVAGLWAGIWVLLIGFFGTGFFCFHAKIYHTGYLVISVIGAAGSAVMAGLPLFDLTGNVSMCLCVASYIAYDLCIGTAVLSSIGISLIDKVDAFHCDRQAGRIKIDQNAFRTEISSVHLPKKNYRILVTSLAIAEILAGVSSIAFGVYAMFRLDSLVYGPWVGIAQTLAGISGIVMYIVQARCGIRNLFLVLNYVGILVTALLLPLVFLLNSVRKLIDPEIGKLTVISMVISLFLFDMCANILHKIEIIYIRKGEVKLLEEDSLSGETSKEF